MQRDFRRASPTPHEVSVVKTVGTEALLREGAVVWAVNGNREVSEVEKGNEVGDGMLTKQLISVQFGAWFGLRDLGSLSESP